MGSPVRITSLIVSGGDLCGDGRGAARLFEAEYVCAGLRRPRLGGGSPAAAVAAMERPC